MRKLSLVQGAFFITIPIDESIDNVIIGICEQAEAIRLRYAEIPKSKQEK